MSLCPISPARPSMSMGVSLWWIRRDFAGRNWTQTGCLCSLSVPGARAPCRNCRVFQCLLFSVQWGDDGSGHCGIFGPAKTFVSQGRKVALNVEVRQQRHLVRWPTVDSCRAEKSRRESGKRRKSGVSARRSSGSIHCVQYGSVRTRWIIRVLMHTRQICSRWRSSKGHAICGSKQQLSRGIAADRSVACELSAGPEKENPPPSRQGR